MKDGAGSLTLDGEVIGSGDVQLNNGTLALNAANTYSGGTTLLGGVVQVGNNNALGTGAVDFDGGAMRFGASATIGNAITLTSDGSVDAAGFQGGLLGNISGAGSLIVENSGGANGFIQLGGTNTYSGSTIIVNNATASIIGPNALSPTSDFIVDGRLALNGFSGSIASLSGAGNINNTVAGATLTVSPASGISQFDGTITNDGSAPLRLTKTGAGTQVLTGANTYTGGTRILGGVLQARQWRHNGVRRRRRHQRCHTGDQSIECLYLQWRYLRDRTTSTDRHGINRADWCQQLYGRDDDNGRHASAR